MTIRIDFAPGSRFAIEGVEGSHPVHDALVLTPAREMTSSAVARLTGGSWHRVAAICKRHMDLAVAEAGDSGVTHLAADETSRALNEARRREQRQAPDFKGFRWKLLRAYDRLSAGEKAEIDALPARMPSRRTAMAWSYRERLREILERKQINLVTRMLRQWRTNVMPSRVAAMQRVARMIRKHFGGITAWARTRQTNGCL